MSVIQKTRRNPYVGPRAFQYGETLYGRDQEVIELLDLLIAERIVLLYSPSGAGKTSLIQAALIPELEEERFHVLPVMRVSLEPPPLTRQPSIQPAHQLTNRYILSLLLSLEESLPPKRQTSLTNLAGMELGTYLEQRPVAAGEGYAEVLIFDQFEEILTIEPTNRAAKEAFFAQVGAALRDRRRWALFAMREEYLAGLDPYVRSLPTRLSNTFRLEFLGEETALLAIQQPARQADVDFTDGAAKKLVDDLRRVRVQRPDGTTEEQLGPYVEPVQLQVVCRRLWEKWEKLSADPQQIGEADMEAVGDVDTALAGYYDERVAGIAFRARTSEGDIRAWFDRHLITEHGIRGQVLQEPQQSKGLDNRVIRSLVDAHLVRAERRRGATWYELIHDRFIEPIRESNRAWKRKQLWRWGKMGLAAAVAVMVGMVILTAILGGRATSEGKSALFRQLVGEADSYLDDQPDLALLLGLEAYRIEDNRETRSFLLTGLKHNPYLAAFLHTGTHTETYPVLAVAFSPASPMLASGSADGTVILWDLAAPRPISETLSGHTSEVWSLTFSPDGETLASASVDGAVILWDVATRQPLGEPLTGHTNEVRSVALSPDGKKVALGSADGTITLWDVAARQPLGEPLTGHTNEVRSVAFSPDGQTLASGSCGKLDEESGTKLCIQGEIRLWDVKKREQLGEPLTGHKSEVWSMAFSPDGQTLASGSCGKLDEESETRFCVQGEVRLWKISADVPQALGQPLTGHGDDVYGVAFSPDGQTLASGSADRTLIVWDVATRQPLGKPLTGHMSEAWSLAFSPDGQTLASGSADGTIILWNVTTRQLAGETLTNHTEKVYSVAFSPDGQTLASGSGDETIILWDVAARQPLGEPLTGHAGSVWSVAFSPDGQTLASGSQDSSIILWDLATRQPLDEPLTGHTDSVLSVAFSPVSPTLASGSADGTIILWDLATRQPLGKPLAGHTAAVLSVAFSPDGQTLASGSQDNTVILWDVATGRSLGRPLTGHADSVRSVAFSPDGQVLASGGYDTNIILWDVATHWPLGGPLTGHAERVYSVAFSPDGRTLASGSGDGTIIRWNVATRQPLGKPLTGHEAAVYSVAFSPDGRTLASGSGDTNIILRNAAARELFGQSLGQTLEGHIGSVRSVAFSPVSPTLASGGYDNTIILWDIAAHQPLGEPLTGHEGYVYSVAFSPDGQLLASGSADGKVILWDVAASPPISETLTGHTDEVWSVGFSPDGQLLASGSADGTIVLWDVVTRQPLGRPITAHRNTVVSVAFSPDGQLLASGSCGRRDEESDTQPCIQGEIGLWDVNNREQLGEPLSGHTAYVYSVAFSPDGRTLASGSVDTTIILWDVATREPLGEPLTRHTAYVWSVAFSPDGQTLASGSRDRTVILWDVATRQPLGEALSQHRGAVGGVTFSPDGQLLASGSADKTIILWDVSVESWRKRACRIANRDLTHAEWNEFIGPDIPYRHTCLDLPPGGGTPSSE